MNDFAQRMQTLRKIKNITQGELADKLDVSAQAVSKWENGLSEPDIQMLIKLANIFDVSLDKLVGNEEIEATQILPIEERKDINKMILKINVLSNDGDKIKVNLPMSIIKACVESGMKMPEINGKDFLSNIDLTQVFDLVEQGVIGKLIEVESADGDVISIVVE